MSQTMPVILKEDNMPQTTKTNRQKLMAALTDCIAAAPSEHQGKLLDALEEWEGNLSPPARRRAAPLVNDFVAAIDEGTMYVQTERDERDS